MVWGARTPRLPARPCLRGPAPAPGAALRVRPLPSDLLGLGPGACSFHDDLAALCRGNLEKLPFDLREEVKKKPPALQLLLATFFSNSLSSQYPVSSAPKRHAVGLAEAHHAQRRGTDLSTGSTPLAGTHGAARAPGPAGPHADSAHPSVGEERRAASTPSLRPGPVPPWTTPALSSWGGVCEARTRGRLLGPARSARPPSPFCRVVPGIFLPFPLLIRKMLKIHFRLINTKADRM